MSRHRLGIYHVLKLLCNNASQQLTRCRTWQLRIQSESQTPQQPSDDVLIIIVASRVAAAAVTASSPPSTPLRYVTLRHVGRKTDDAVQCSSLGRDQRPVASELKHTHTDKCTLYKPLPSADKGSIITRLITMLLTTAYKFDD